MGRHSLPGLTFKSLKVNLSFLMGLFCGGAGGLTTLDGGLAQSLRMLWGCVGSMQSAKNMHYQPWSPNPSMVDLR